MPDAMNELQKPVGTPAPKADEPEIHVIPEQFYGAALKKKVVKEKPPAAPVGSAPLPPPPVPPTPTGPGMPGGPKKGGKLNGKRGIILAIVGLLLLTAGVAAAYYAMVLSRPANTNRPVNANQNVNAPSVAQCGNARCETGETTASCPADCPAPAPSCGDAKCEGDETNASCPADCAAPAPSCGNDQCEEGETPASCQEDCAVPAPTAGTDSDTDGLTDEEERAVFGTNPNNPNSDADSYVDLNEALNLFDPASPAPAMLADNPGFATQNIGSVSASMLRPSSWTVKEASFEDASVDFTFTAPTGEFIAVTSGPAITAQQTLLDWYMALAPGVNASQVEISKTKAGDEVITSPDRLASYVRRGDKVLVISYNLGPRTEVQYRVTFQAMVRSVANAAQ